MSDPISHVLTCVWCSRVDQSTAAYAAHAPGSAQLYTTSLDASNLVNFYNSNILDEMLTKGAQGGQ